MKIHTQKQESNDYFLAFITPHTISEDKWQRTGVAVKVTWTNNSDLTKDRFVLS